jgi:putative membrane protein
MTRKTATRAGAAFVALPAAVLMAAGPAVAADGDVVVTNTETVQAYLSASGKLDVARVYEQVALKGKGSVSLSNPVETNGLRNLDGFGGFEVRDGNVVGTYEVDGEKRLRTVSDYTRSLPLEVDVTYTLDGREVKPGDVVGKSGRLKVQYTVRNVTGKPRQVSFDDGTGTSATATEDVVIPMVGSLSTVLPATFTDVRSAEANMAGDGRGGTKMSFTMTLFGPIGKPEATFGYEAQITDGVVPKASISALPVSPLDSPSFKGGAASYKGGAQTGATLAAGATEIDANLLKLRDGAGELLAGLIQLRDGADQLNAGLSGEAAPGARRLSDGAGKLKDGTGRLAAGAGEAKAGSAQVAGGAEQVAGGAGQLADGLNQAGSQAPALIDGLVQVAEGLEKIDAGLVALHGGIGQLPAKATPLHDGIAKLRAGIGSTATADTLLFGVDQVRGGIASATAAGAARVCRRPPRTRPRRRTDGPATCRSGSPPRRRTTSAV